MPENTEPSFKLIHILSPVYFIPLVATLAILFLLTRTYAIVASVDTARQL